MHKEALGAEERVRCEPALGVPGFRYADLHDPERLAALTRAFEAALLVEDPELHRRYEGHRSGRAPLQGTEESELLVALASPVSRFVGRLFRTGPEQAALREQAGRDAPLFRVKREFVQRRVFRKGAAARPSAADFHELDAAVQPLLAAAAQRDPLASRAARDPELLFALLVDALLGAETALKLAASANSNATLTPTATATATPTPTPTPTASDDRIASWRAIAHAIARGLRERGKQELASELGGLRGDATTSELLIVQRLLDVLDRWCFAAALHPAGRERTWGWSLLRLPQALDFERLVPLRRPSATLSERIEGLEERRRRRDGFALTDPRMTPREVRSEIDYCLYCHEREKDSCSKGFLEKGAEPRRPSARYRKNPLGIPLTGCPLEERISEAHLVAKEEDAVGALALICIDNPMAPGTGHRICNDCMKACVYQKQDPVDIPQIETRVLTDVLRLPWGFEIWSLLTRWNPLNVERQHPRPYVGVDVLVVGLGPAGYTLAHHLLNEGFGVVAVDGLKIEPLPEELLGREGAVPQPIERIEERFGAPLGPPPGLVGPGSVRGGPGGIGGDSPPPGGGDAEGRGGPLAASERRPERAEHRTGPPIRWTSA